jgi:dTDP-4-amino-4,6-dideoxygalactose transaminase
MTEGGGSAWRAKGTVAWRRWWQALFGRRLAQLGGSTSWADCAVALRYVIDRGQLVDGPAIAAYEHAFATTIGVREGIAFASGRIGLHGLLRCLDIGEGDEVILQVPTHIVVPNAIRFAGARPIYVDCRLDSYNIDLEEAERKISPRTRAIVIQHTFGVPADIQAAMALAERHGIVVLEDCVHALGATLGGRMLGSFGRAAFFSTEETKTISSTMGGMVVTDDHALAERLRTFASGCARPSADLTARYLLKLIVYHIATQPRLHRWVRAAYDRGGRRQPLPRATSREEMAGRRPRGYEQRLGNGQAAVAHRQLQRLAANVDARRAAGREYAVLLADTGHQPPRVPDGAEPSYVRYPVWVDDREGAMAAVASHAVLGNWFTSVLEEAVSPDVGGYVAGSCPRAEACARHLVNLPTHPRVSAADRRAIAASLHEHARATPPDPT